MIGENGGEINTQAYQMPGTVSHPEQLEDQHIWYAGSWHAFTGTQRMTDPTRFAALVNNDWVSLTVEDLRCND